MGSFKLKASRQAAQVRDRDPRRQQEQQQSASSSERDRHLSHESVTLFSNIGGLDGFHGRSSRSQQQQQPQQQEPGDLERRFWKQGGVDARRHGSGSISLVPAAFQAQQQPSSRGASLVKQQAREQGQEDVDFSQLPFDVLRRISGGFSLPNLWAASMVCKSWYQALSSLREAVTFVKWGKMYKHGRGGVPQDTGMALDSFLKGAARGCAAAMIDAGLLLWEQGRREEGIQWYRKAAELGDAAGQCNLGLALLQEPVDASEAVKWFQRASDAGHVRAQYSLALCLQQGRGVEPNPGKAARWYLRAAEGGSSRAMYNTALCFLSGEGFARNYHHARHWMRRAALAGHRKAQFEHGLTLFAEGDGGLALAFLELATRAGETAAIHIRDALVQQLPAQERANAIACADKWKKQMRRG
ncbi:F-box protein At1g70590 [Selaginella moellendorffii]|nr:F-box protein At1g70590 [Selaginella moellendorffii]|eukprot:XP_002987821.2 F-box protein At1g70590 [Selaginella moellendorffii]